MTPDKPPTPLRCTYCGGVLRVVASGLMWIECNECAATWSAASGDAVELPRVSWWFR